MLDLSFAVRIQLSHGAEAGKARCGGVSGWDPGECGYCGVDAGSRRPLWRAHLDRLSDAALVLSASAVGAEVTAPFDDGNVVGRVFQCPAFFLVSGGSTGVSWLLPPSRLTPSGGVVSKRIQYISRISHARFLLRRLFPADSLGLFVFLRLFSFPNLGVLRKTGAEIPGFKGTLILLFGASFFADLFASSAHHPVPVLGWGHRETPDPIAVMAAFRWEKTGGSCDRVSFVFTGELTSESEAP